MGRHQAEYPLGISPRWAWDEQRYSDLARAIERYLNAGLRIDPLWVDEYNELHKRIDERQNK